MKNLIFAFCLGALLVGCAGGGRQSLYHWDGEYQKSLYLYLNEEGDINEQISSLEKSIAKAEASAKKVPPGLYAHVGLLYNALGNTAAAKSYFQKEAQAFPQSRGYMEFLLSDKKAKKGAK